MLLGAFGRGMGLMELGAAGQGGSNAAGDGESPGGQQMEQNPGAWGERWTGSLAEGESCTGLRFRAEKWERLQI